MSVEFGIHKHRMEALIDGVFAIAMTILVLEIKVPELANPSDGMELMRALQHHASVIFAYFLSFAMLGVFWVWHHRMATKVREIDGALMFCSLVFLSLICFFPFAAALLGRYILHTPMVLVVYLPVLGLILLSQTLYFFLADQRGLLLESLPVAEVRAAHRVNLYGCTGFAFSSIPAALTLGLPAAGACLLLGVLLIILARKFK